MTVCACQPVALSGGDSNRRMQIEVKGHFGKCNDLCKPQGHDRLTLKENAKEPRKKTLDDLELNSFFLELEYRIEQIE